jgi:hypothetical protein
VRIGVEEAMAVKRADVELIESAGGPLAGLGIRLEKERLRIL